MYFVVDVMIVIFFYYVVIMLFGMLLYGVIDIVNMGFGFNWFDVFLYGFVGDFY